jgi:hypothetical protein
MIAPPDDWTWVEGTISHVDMMKNAEEDTLELVKAIDKGYRPDYLLGHENAPSNDWEDNLLHFYDEREDRIFHFRGTNDGQC